MCAIITWVGNTVADVEGRLRSRDSAGQEDLLSASLDPRVMLFADTSVVTALSKPVWSEAYPACLAKLYGRRIQKGLVTDFAPTITLPFFVKPAGNASFSAQVVRTPAVVAPYLTLTGFYPHGANFLNQVSTPTPTQKP